MPPRISAVSRTVVAARSTFFTSTVICAVRTSRVTAVAAEAASAGAAASFAEDATRSDPLSAADPAAAPPAVESLELPSAPHPASRPPRVSTQTKDTSRLIFVDLRHQVSKALDESAETLIRPRPGRFGSAGFDQESITNSTLPS